MSANNRPLFAAEGDVFGSPHYLCKREVKPGFFLYATPVLSEALGFATQEEVDRFVADKPSEIRLRSWVLTSTPAGAP